MFGSYLYMNRAKPSLLSSYELVDTIFGIQTNKHEKINVQIESIKCVETPPWLGWY